MGSAFCAEPPEWFQGIEDEPVLFLTFPSDAHAETVCHRAHDECQIEQPHQMAECGRFAEVKP